MGRFDFEPGDEIGIGFDLDFDRPAQRLSEPRPAGFLLGFGQRTRRFQAERRTVGADARPRRLGQSGEPVRQAVEKAFDARLIGQTVQ